MVLCPAELTEPAPRRTADLKTTYSGAGTNAQAVVWQAVKATVVQIVTVTRLQLLVLGYATLPF